MTASASARISARSAKSAGTDAGIHRNPRPPADVTAVPDSSYGRSQPAAWT
jgi:hypothetical protein